MSGFSASITRDVNANVAKGRGPVGKGTRKTAYNQLLRTNQEEVVQHIRCLRAKRRCANQRSRVDDPHQLKWFLEESRGGVYDNLEQFKYFSSLLQRKTGKQPAQAVLVEFVVFLLGCPQHHAEFGADITTTTKAASVTVDEDVVDEDWESSCGRGASMALVESEWGGMETPDFGDEEDQVCGWGGGR